jgi:hypothetical protein
MDQFLLNSNKRCESEDKQGTLSTSGKSVKKCKNLKYDSYLDFGFMSPEVDGEERPQCVLCMKVLASKCVLPSKLKHHLETTHPRVTSRQGNNEEQTHMRNKGTNEHDWKETVILETSINT